MTDQEGPIIMLLVKASSLVAELPGGQTGAEVPPDPCEVICAEHRRHCAYVWPHPAHHCSLCDGWDQEPLTPERLAQLRALGIDMHVTEG